MANILKFQNAIKPGTLNSAPSGSSEGVIYYDLTNDVLRYQKDSAFVDVADFDVLASTANGEGASLIGVEDSADNFTATDLEGVLAELYTLASSGVSDAADVTYTPSVLTDWDGDADPGNVDDALDQLAERVDDNEIAIAAKADQSVVDEIDQNVDDLITLSGVAENSTHLGTFTGSTIPDSQTVKQALQALETEVELKADTSYVDSQIAAYINGVRPKQAARVAADADVDIATELEDGDSLDGVTLATGDRVLLTAQSDAEDNGIYVVQASGAAVRSADFDSLTPIDEINGAYLPVQEGTYQGALFVQYGTVATLGTDPINFTYVPAITSVVGGDMITVTGNSIAVDLHAVSGLESSNPGNDDGELRIKLEATDPSLQIDGSNQLGAKLYSGGAIIKNASGLAANVDDSSIEISSNALQVKDLGISSGKLQDNSVSDAKLRDSAALSVIGRSANSSGDPADIAAGTDHFVLRRSGTSLAFGLLTNNNIDPAAGIVYSKLDLTDSIVDADINSAAGIDASKLADGSVSNTEFQYISTLTSNAQDQLDAKLENVVEDTTPQLGGHLDLNDQSLTGPMRRAADASPTKYIEQEYIHGTTLTGGTTAVASAFTFDSKAVKAQEIAYTIVSGNNRRVGRLMVVADNASGVAASTLSLVDQSTETADIEVSWAAAMNGDNVELSYTTGTGAKTMRADVTRYYAAD